MIKKIIGNEKKILLFIIIALVLLLILFLVLKKYVFNDKDSKFREYLYKQKIDELNIKENDEILIAEKYKLVSAKKYGVKEKIVLGNFSGKMIYIRGKEMNANIYQIQFTEENYLDDIPVIVQVDQYINSFTEEVLKELKIPLDLKPIEEKVYGKTIYDFEIPIEEIVYKYKILYTKTYEFENRKIDFNYYMNEEVLICEVVNLL